MDQLPYFQGSPDPDGCNGSYQPQQEAYGGFFDHQAQTSSFSPFQQFNMPFFDNNTFLQQQQQQLLAQQQFFYQQQAYFNGGAALPFTLDHQQASAMQESVGTMQYQHQQHRKQHPPPSGPSASRGGRGKGLRKRKAVVGAPPPPPSSSSRISAKPGPTQALDRQLGPNGTHPLRPKIDRNVSLNSQASFPSSSSFGRSSALLPTPTTKLTPGAPVYNFSNPSPTPIADAIRIYGLPPTRDPYCRLYGDHREIAVLEGSTLVKLLTAWGEKTGSRLGVDALSGRDRDEAPHPGAVALLEEFWKTGAGWDWQDEFETDALCRIVGSKTKLPPKVVKVTWERWRTMRICIGEERGGGIGLEGLESEERGMAKKARMLEEPSSSRPRIANGGSAFSSQPEAVSHTAEDDAMGGVGDALDSGDEIEDFLVASQNPSSVTLPLSTSTTSRLPSPSHHQETLSSASSHHSNLDQPSSTANPIRPSLLSDRLSMSSLSKQRLSDLLPLGHTFNDASKQTTDVETEDFFSSLVLPPEEHPSSSILSPNSTSTATSTLLTTTVSQPSNSNHDRIRERLDRLRQSSVTSNTSTSSGPLDPIFPPSQPSDLNVVPVTEPAQLPPPPSIHLPPLLPQQNPSITPQPHPSSFPSPSRLPSEALEPPTQPSLLASQDFPDSSSSSTAAIDADRRPSEYGTSFTRQLSPAPLQRTRSTYTDLLPFFLSSPSLILVSPPIHFFSFHRSPPSTSSSRPQPPHLSIPLPPGSQARPRPNTSVLSTINGNPIAPLFSSSQFGAPSEEKKKGSERSSVAVEEKKKKQGGESSRPLPPGWEAKFSKTKRATWYYHRPSKATSWSFPPQV